MGKTAFNRSYQTNLYLVKSLKNIKNPLSFLMLLGLLLSSCLPATDNGPKVTIEELNQSSSFYPHQTGLTWEYLPDGGDLNSQRAIMRVQGPKVIDGERYIVTNISGRGLDVSSYKKYLADGVFVSREEGPGYVLSLDPPIKELPAQGNLRVGVSWRGSSKAEIHFTDAPPNKNKTSFTTEYVYTVVDKRLVRLNVGEFEVYVINLESRKLGEEDKVLETLHTEIWFSPFVGEVRNQYDFVLVGGNFKK